MKTSGPSQKLGAAECGPGFFAVDEQSITSVVVIAWMVAMRRLRRWPEIKREASKCGQCRVAERAVVVACP
jgi:hypothetical protein